MKEQNFKNHGRYIFLFHIATWGAVLAVIIGSIINLVHSSKENLYSASLLVVVSLILASLSWYSRQFALRAQDRAIRVEENFRHLFLQVSHWITGCGWNRSLLCVLHQMESLPLYVNRQ